MQSAVSTAEWGRGELFAPRAVDDFGLRDEGHFRNRKKGGSRSGATSFSGEGKGRKSSPGPLRSGTPAFAGMRWEIFMLTHKTIEFCR